MLVSGQKAFNMFLFAIFSLFLWKWAFASPLLKRIPQTLAIAAFGDSYSAGIGAGRFFQGSTDNRDNICARMTGSYPVHLQKMFDPEPSLDFLSCSGDILDDIDKQVASLSGKKVDLATLSISGNDFNFANVVASCVYSERTDVMTQDLAQQACDRNLQMAEASVIGDNIFDKFVSKVRLIKGSLKDYGLLYVTGYARFFSDRGFAGDTCDQTTFFNSFWLRELIGVLPMSIQNRQRMNDIVDLVNMRIQQDVVNALQGELNIIFVDIDSQFDGRRFCEPNRDPWGSNDPRVQFNDLFTTLPETTIWEGSADADELWTAKFNASGLTDPELVGRDIDEQLQQRPIFHPKELAHTITAAKIFLGALGRITQRFTRESDTICKGFSSANADACFDVPMDCVKVDTEDQSKPVIVCPGGHIISDVEIPPEATIENSDPSPLKSNLAGTNIHVNKGCAYINDILHCAGGDPFNVAFQNNEVSIATIQGKVPSNPSDTSDTSNMSIKQVTAGCKLDAFFPYYYEDIFFGEDGCLYDATGAQIASQCCSDTADAQVQNPYIGSG